MKIKTKYDLYSEVIYKGRPHIINGIAARVSARVEIQITYIVVDKANSKRTMLVYEKDLKESLS